MAKRATRKKREADPPRQIAELEAALSKGTPGGIYALRGEERYFQNRAIVAVRSRAEALGWEVAVHGTKDPDFDAGRLLGDLSGGSLFSAGRCVVVRDAAPLVKKDGKKDSPFVRAALAFVESSDLDGCLVVAADSLRADSALAKAAVSSGGALVGCRKLWDSAPPWNPDPRQSELVQWLVSRARELSVALSVDQALYVAAAVGNDLFELEAALEKVGSTGGRALAEIVGWSASVSPFQVADDLVAGNARRAVMGVEGLFRGGFQERDGTRLVDSGGLSAILLSSVQRQVRQCVAGAAALVRGRDAAEGASRAGWSVPPRKKGEFEQRVRQRPPREWRRMLEEVSELELGARTGTVLDANVFCHLALRWRCDERGALAGGAR